MTKRLFLLAFLVGFLATVTACGPLEGQTCSHKGDVRSTGGQTYKCRSDKHGKLTWEK